MIEELYGTARIRFSGLALPRLPRALDSATEAVLSELPSLWRETFGPRHFRREAFAAYSGYEGDYIYSQRKSRGPDADPLVSRFGNRGSYKWRGRWEMNPPHAAGNLRKAFLKGTMVMRPQGKHESRQVRVSWPNLPRYTYVDQHGRTRAQGPRKYLELTMTNQQEAQALAAEFTKRLEAHLKKEES